MLGMLTLGGHLLPMVRLFVLLFTAAWAGVPCERLLLCSIIDLGFGFVMVVVYVVSFVRQS